MGRPAIVRTWGSKGVCFFALAPWLFLGALPSIHGTHHGWTAQQWREWRDSRIAWILRPDLETQEGKVLSRGSVVEKCGVALEQLDSIRDGDSGSDPENEPGMAHFVRFVTAQHWMGVKDREGNKTHVLGSSITDGEYLDSATPFVQLPALLASRQFLTALGQPSTYRSALAMIDARNDGLAEDARWSVLTYRSQFILSVDRTTYGRLLIAVPARKLEGGGSLEQWIQFAIATPDTSPSAVIQSVSVVARVHLPNGEVHSYFVDLLRHKNPLTGEFWLSSTYSMKPMPSSNCFNCHKTAVISIHPRSLLRFDRHGTTEVAADGDEQVAKLNRMAQSYRGPEKLFVDPQDYGPSLGSGTREILDAELSTVAGQNHIDAVSLDRIRKSADCTACHGEFAPLNFDLSVSTDRDASSFESKRGIAQTYIENGYMPPGNRLSPEERRVLWIGLSRAYFDPKTGQGAFVDWLKGKP
jgi:hypothetical protein